MFYIFNFEKYLGAFRLLIGSYNGCIPFIGQIICYCIDIPQFIYSSADGFWVSFTFCLLWCSEYSCTFSPSLPHSLLGKYILKSGNTDSHGKSMFSFLETTVSYKVTVPFYHSHSKPRFLYFMVTRLQKKMIASFVHIRCPLGSLSIFTQT